MARLIRPAADLEQLGDGEALVTETTDPGGEPVLRRGAAIVAGTALAVDGVSVER